MEYCSYNDIFYNIVVLLEICLIKLRFYKSRDAEKNLINRGREVFVLDKNYRPIVDC